MALVMPRPLYRQRLGAAVMHQRVTQSTVIAIPPPITGWNARDSLDGMQPTDAVTMINWIPGLGRVDLRPGSSIHATGVGGGAVETVAEYNAGLTRKLLAAGGGDIYDASAAGAVGAALLSGQTGNEWNTTHLGGTQVWVNGVNGEQTFDGTVFAGLTFTGANRPTPGTVTVCHTHQRRVYYSVNAAGVGSGGPGDVYYSSLDGSVTAVEVFTLSEIAPRGGDLVNILTVSRDAALDTLDFLAFVLSSGQTLVYAGLNPDSTTWSLVGIYDLGGAVHPRMAVKVGGDAILGGRDGYSSLSQAMRTARTDPATMLSHQISRAVLEAIDVVGVGADGWQMMHYPRRGWMLVNVPLRTTGTQHLINLVTGAWCELRGLAARSWTLFNDVPYYGAETGGNVWRWDDGSLSDDGAEIEGILETAFRYFDDRSRQKKLSAIRPIFEVNGATPISVSMSSDFKRHSTAVLNTTFGSGAAFTPWGSPWGSPWSADVTSSGVWIGQAKSGFNFSTRYRVSTNTRAIGLTSEVFDMVGMGAW